MWFNLAVSLFPASEKGNLETRNFLR